MRGGVCLWGRRPGHSKLPVRFGGHMCNTRSGRSTGARPAGRARAAAASIDLWPGRAGGRPQRIDARGGPGIETVAVTAARSQRNHSVQPIRSPRMGGPVAASAGARRPRPLLCTGTHQQAREQASQDGGRCRAGDGRARAIQIPIAVQGGVRVRRRREGWEARAAAPPHAGGAAAAGGRAWTYWKNSSRSAVSRMRVTMRPSRSASRSMLPQFSAIVASL